MVNTLLFFNYYNILVLFFCDSSYFWSIPFLESSLNNLSPKFRIHFPINDLNKKSASTSFVSIAGHSFLLNKSSSYSLDQLKENLADYSVFFLGSAETTLFSMIYLNLSYLTIKICNPYTSQNLLISDTGNVIFRGSPSHRVISRRYYLVEEIKKANIIGIICGTLSTTKYLELVSYCKKLIESNVSTYLVLFFNF